MNLLDITFVLLNLLAFSYGQCPISTITSFLNSPTVTTTLTLNGNPNLPTNGIDNTMVLPGAMVPFRCNNGYTLVSGQLNVTCVGTTWTTFPTCALSSGIPSATLPPSAVTDNPCMVDATTLTIANGFPASTALSYRSATTATGSIQFACGAGYALNPAVGASYVCNNGVWSTKPTCVPTGRCSFTQLQQFISTATGLQTTAQSNLMQVPGEATQVLSGSYIVFMCVSGYTNVGGSFNVTCSPSGTWSQYPSCVTGTGVNPTVPPTTGGDVPCMVDSTTVTVTYGYPTNVGLMYRSSTTATGSVQFACYTGYMLDPMIGASFTCNNGVWSTKPRCNPISRCSFTDLQQFMSRATNMQTTGQTNLMQVPGESTQVLSGSYTVLACVSGFTNVGGSLNITCTPAGTWTPYPNCVTGTGGNPTVPPTTGGDVPCMVDSTTVTVTYGYPTNVGLMYRSSTTATGSVQFACYTGYMLDPMIGASFTCNNGVWSTKPRCNPISRCSLSELQQFMSRTTGIQTVGTPNLMQVPGEQDRVLGGSFMMFACITGYNNIGGNLNVTCMQAGTWSMFPNCVVGGGVNPTIPPTSNDIPCLVDGTTVTIPNGFYSNNSLNYRTSTTATGSLQFACNFGYMIDPTIGNMFYCTNGVWSPKPRCMSTGRCQYGQIQQFASALSGMQMTGQMSLMQVPGETTLVLAGSYVLFTCMSGFTNVGGNLNVTCSPSGTWSQFPNCVAGGGTNPTVPPTSNDVPCMIDSMTMTITNGYPASSTLNYRSATTATGSIQFACNPGYQLNPAVGASFMCNNGVWSTKPNCIASLRCAFSALQQFLSTATGVQSTSMSNLMTATGEQDRVLVGSYIVFTCMSGLTNIGGNLNVTCTPSGTWSQFPNCVSSMQTTTMAPVGALPCSYSTSLMSIPNGFSTSSFGLMQPTVTQALSGAYIDYMCFQTFTMSGMSRMTCTNGVWSPQPTCVAAGQMMTTTTTPAPSGCDAIPNVPNSYVSNATYTQTGLNTFSRRVEFTCNPGFTYTSITGQRAINCVNGVWEPLPTCTESPVCSLSALQSALVNVEIGARSLNAARGGVLAGGWIQLRCAPGFNLNPFSGSLNVTCQANGVWTTFPICSR